MTDDVTLETPVQFLCNSPAGRLHKARRNEWLPYGARAARGGVAMTETGEVLGWIAYANTADDLACTSWPAQAMSLSFDQVFPASVEIEVVHRGGDWRRAAGSVNAVLGRECGVTDTRIDFDHCERAHRTVSGWMAGRAHANARRAFSLRLASEPLRTLVHLGVAAELLAHRRQHLAGVRGLAA